MEDAGQKLKKIRESLNLRYRDVDEASQKIVLRRKNDEFRVALSRLADIENSGVVPTIFRLYSLCAIYRLDILEVLEWFGVPVSEMAGDALEIDVENSHLVGFREGVDAYVNVPLSLDPGIDLKGTNFLGRHIRRWGKLPLLMLNGYNLKNRKFAFIGTDDWSMYPLIQPGAFVVIDDSRKKIAGSGWTGEHDRPIYFFDHRDGYSCAWLSEHGDQVVVQPHPSSTYPVRIYGRTQIDIIGEVYATATRLDRGRRRRPRSAAEREEPLVR